MIDYNAFLIILAGLALIGGIFYGLYYNKIFTFFKVEQNRNNIHNSIIKREEKKENSEEITKSNIIKKNFQLLEDEIKIYKFEKDLVSKAIENILVASKNKTIDPFEKDRLLLKYNDQLKKLNKKMEKLQSEIDVTKLLDLRHDLISILENKISGIDEKIKEINFNFTNKSIKNNKLKDYPSFYDIEGSVDDASLNSRKVINYKNSNLNKKKETIVKAEKDKIVNLKEQVLTALNRLDRANIIKEEIESKIVVMEENHDKNDSIKDEKLSEIQNKSNFDTKYLNLNEDKNPSGITNKEKVAFPKIFNFLKNNKSDDENDKINNNNTKPSYNILSSSLLKNNNTPLQSIIKNDENVNKIKLDDSLNKIRHQSNYNNNKSNSNSNSNSNSSSSNVNSSSPLFNLLNNNKLKVEHSINNNDYNSNKDKSIDKQYLNQDRSKKFKFPLSFIFSKRNKKEKEIENKKDYYVNYTEKRRDSLSNMLK